MIIKSILLNNIRSYKSPDPIQLDAGVTLFEGDIGSGKSTILSAIEFALFGLGDQESSYLLRHGEINGSVLLEFEVNGKKFQVYRSLRRKRKSISQNEGYIVEEGVHTDYSVTEMKNRILQILNFNESPRPKTSSLIYRYAIFTPQEMMKEVLLQPVERRLETLRRAFRIEDYSVIVNNASVLLTWLGGEAKLLDRQTQNIAEKRQLLEDEKKHLEKFKKDFKEISGALKVLEAEQTRILKELEELQPRKETVKQLEVEIPALRKSLQGKNRQLDDIKSRIQSLQGQLNEISEAEKAVAELSPEYEEYSSKKARREQLEPQIQQINDLNGKKIGLRAALEKEKSQLEKRVSDLQKEIRKEEERISKQKAETSKITELEQEENTLAAEIEQLPTVSEQLISLNKNQAALEQKIRSKRERSEELEAELEELRKIGVGAPCPKCKQELTQQHYSEVEEEYLSDVEKLNKRIEELENEEKQNKESIDETAAQKASLKEKERRLNKLRQTLSGLRQQEANLAENEESLKTKRKTLEDNQKLLEEDTFGENERKQIECISSQLAELEPVREEYEQVKDRIKTLEKSKIEERYLNNKAKVNNKETVTKDLSQSQEREADLIAEIASDDADLQKKIGLYDREKPVLEIIDKLENEKTEVEKAKNDKSAELVGINKDIEHSEEEISRIEGEVKTMEEQLLRRDELKQYKLWISEYFNPAVKQIETNVLTSINTEFNSLFQKWISYLLEAGDISVRVDGNFTPVIEQNGYEMDVESLSGGEKTSVALAYRLALNVMVKKVCEAMHSNLLILDEPTDGFSREQLFRLRDILKELNCEQVIAVSHESELESFVDKIFRITKEAGESKISSS